MYGNGSGLVAVIIIVFIIIVILALLWWYGAGTGALGGYGYVSCGCAQANQISHLVRCRKFRELNPSLTYQQFCQQNNIAWTQGQNWPAY